METAPKTWYGQRVRCGRQDRRGDLDDRGEDSRGSSAYPVGERSPEVGEDGLQQEEHERVADRLDGRSVEPLHDVGRQEERHTPVADSVGGVDEPTGDKASPYAGQLPKPGLGSPAENSGPDLDVAMRLGDASSHKKQDNGGDNRDDECRLPTKVRHQGQRDTCGEDITQREE